MSDTKAWDAYSRSRPPRRQMNAKGEATWFNWTQHADHGPGVELLGIKPGAAVLELGCGKAGNLAHVAALGARAVGVDVSPVQLAAARERWGGLAGLELHQADALHFMSETTEQFDAVFSVFGAVWFTDPDVMLPAVRQCIRPGGVFAFSQRPPMEECYGCQASYITRPDDAEPLVVKRWDHIPDTWAARLIEHGFARAAAEVVPAPEGSRKTGTLLVRAEVARS